MIFTPLFPLCLDISHMTLLRVITSSFLFFFWTVPSAPAKIKAFASALNKIIVSWLPPTHKNGELTGYTFYMALRSGGKEVLIPVYKLWINWSNSWLELCIIMFVFLFQEEPHKRKFQESVTINEIVRSQESTTYQFWVTASTKVGEGESTTVVTVPPVSKGKDSDLIILW